jgi:capsular exopolysaccharide synthesis family protein
MDSTPPQPDLPQTGEHGAATPGYRGYAGYGYGYEYGSTVAQRSFQQYLLTLRERFWYIVAVFLLVFSSVLVYTLTRQKLFQSAVTAQIFRRGPVVMQVQGVMDNDVSSAEDLNTQVKILESASIVQKVAARLAGSDLERMLAPYRRPDGRAPGVQGIIAAGRKILPQRSSLIVNVQFQHPDPAVAAQVANLIADEYIAYNEKVRTDESLKAVEDLRDRAEEQRKKVDQLAVDLQAYRERNNLVSLDQRKDINTEKLKALNAYLTETSNRVADAEVRWEQIQQRRAKHQDLTDLPFIIGQSLIAQLTQQLAAQQIVIAQLRERYRDKHPKMIEAVNSLAQIRRELDRAVGAAAEVVQADYQTALNNNLAARQALVAQEADSLKLDRFAVDYDNLQRQYEVNVKLLEQILSRMSETSVSGTIETQSARIVDRAVPPRSPVFPDIPRNLGLGLVGGLVLGVAFAFFVAFVDDRVKSIFDIESVVGLPILGVVPHMKGQDFTEKATVVVNDVDRLVSEAFRSLYASLRLREESRSAKCLLVTSTLPGEGKSFIVSNLALAFAAHRERTLIIDGDLRRPAVHRIFGKENKRGLIDVVAGRLTFDEAVVHDVFPCLDVLPAGGRAHNPTQILNDPALERLVADLRTRYERIFFDTPPMAAVSDALMILPLTDGCLFMLCFNKVRRKTAQFCARKLLETTVPCFGAVLNNLNLAVSGYYYSQYYDKSYKDYYITPAPDGAAPEAKGRAQSAKGREPSAKR